ncbi:MAG: hypothetical protein QXU04_07790, partial [Archaeoglobaceae archaeon]
SFNPCYEVQSIATNQIAVSLIIKTEKTEKTREFFRIADNLVTSLSVYEETFYIWLKLLADKRLGIKSPFSLREYIRKNGYDFASDFITSLDELFSKINLKQYKGFRRCERCSDTI